MVLCLVGVQTHTQDDVNTMFILLNIDEEIEMQRISEPYKQQQICLI